MNEPHGIIETPTSGTKEENASAIININHLDLTSNNCNASLDDKSKNDDKELKQTDQDFDDNVSDITTLSNPRNYNNPTIDDHNRGLTITLERPSGMLPPTHQASQDSKYRRYFLLVDLAQNDRAVEIILASMRRPHMRSFHFAWISFFLCFFLWFSLSPLLVEVERSLGLTKQELWISNIYSVLGSAILRVTIGPLCDRFGARSCISVVMFVSAIATSSQAAVKTPLGLNIARAIVGFAGSSFVTSVYWTSSMFTREVAGTANAIAAGWGNLGGAAAQLVMGTILVPLFVWIYSINSLDPPEVIEDKAWRTAIIIPGVVVLIFTFFIFQYSDDCPKGNYTYMQRHGLMSKVNTMKSLYDGIIDRNTLILLVQYGCCFGVETTINNLATIYFREEFEMPLAAAAATAAVFGIMNIFARGLGGFVSDYSYALKGMQGRLISHSVLLVLEGLLLIVFSAAATLPGAIIALAVFSIFVQMAEGSTYGIVPNVIPDITGSITGLVGSGGSIGAIFFFFLLSQYPYRTAMKIIGLIVISSSILSIFICIPGHNSLLNIKPCNERVEERQEPDAAEEATSVISNIVVIPASIPSRNACCMDVPNADSISSSDKNFSQSETHSLNNNVEESAMLQCNTAGQNSVSNEKTLHQLNSNDLEHRANSNDDNINLHTTMENPLVKK